MKSQYKIIAAGALMLVGVAAAVYGHCQIPCGIYDDGLRFTLMREHVTTIEKSMKEIERLGQETPRNDNQIVRWVSNKDLHADELSGIVTHYFMAQRVKPVAKKDNEAGYAKYIEQLTLLHRMLVQTMRTKQTSDLDHCAQLRTLIDQFEKSYAGK